MLILPLPSQRKCERPLMLTSSQNHSASPDGVLMQLNSTRNCSRDFKLEFTMSVVMLMVVCCAVICRGSQTSQQLQMRVLNPRHEKVISSPDSL